MYLAHISADKQRQQTLLAHLEGTALRAGRFAAAFDCEGWGYGCGYLHDIGKYSKSFQKRLQGGARTDHATAGARELYDRKNYIGAYCVCGHHFGLLDGGTVSDSGGEATFMGRMKKELDDYQAFQQEVTVPAFPKLPLQPLGKGGFSLSFFIRMLFSCLVDADYLDTEAFMLGGSQGTGSTEEDSTEADSTKADSAREDSSEADSAKEDSTEEGSTKADSTKEDSAKEDGSEEGRAKADSAKEGRATVRKIARGRYDSIATLLQRLQAHVAPWLENTDQATINGRRSAILNACFEKGQEGQGIFELTVPTGGGKTISSLAFALTHAQQHGLGRVIYVVPYTSIIEQNAQVFRDILGKENVLEDHCNVTFESAEELNANQLAAENWDKPVIVTTNVQFFESLFSNRTSKCRKLHNIANSVVIFDEAQMFPVNYLLPCVRAISELVFNYHSTAVLCTATQPSLREYFPPQLKIREICPDVKEQYEFFRRTDVKSIGELSEEELLERLRGQEQVLCILNSRKRAQRVYEALKDELGEGVYHLSTLMYPTHRKRLLKEIRRRLSEGRVCRLVATSLVEAGVDFDFKTVYRELAGLDSVIQAAGRCNREGRRERSLCETVVFRLEKTEDIHTPSDLKLPIRVAEQVADRYEDLASLEAIGEYFKRLYHYRGESLDAKDIVGQLERGFPSYLIPFASVAEQFHLIESATKTILIDVEPEAADLVRRLKYGEHSRQLVRAAGHYCVNVYEKDFENLNGAGRLEEIASGFYRLRNGEQYTEDMGLTLNIGRGEAVFG